MSILFIVGLIVCFTSEMAGNPALEQAGLNQDMGSMEGKEVRFGIAQSVFSLRQQLPLPQVLLIICTIH